MSYVTSILQPGESIVYKTGLHWRVYTPAILLLILTLAFFLFSRQAGQGGLGAILYAAAVICALITVIAWLRGFIERYFTELAVTDRRVIYKRGILNRHTIEMNMSKVESVDVDQTIPGRLLGYGMVTIHGTGGGVERLPNIDNPLRFRNYVTAA
jgi:uncharacterized membrane protein YdbT with pleckstrin-like domain